ncbi:MAG TPA: diacylglycerol kinase family protein [Patescibacteria group bacterium]|nr:diacylglycerol kinase family protein [Patescibacteria group bacterium]
MEKIAILFNPSAGKGRAELKRRTLQKCLKEEDIACDWFESRHEDDLRDLVKVTATDYPTLVAAGGDTTLLIVINELMRLKADNTLGMIGLGSCNDVVKEFEIHSLKKACQAIRRNRSRQIDLGVVREGRKILRYYPGQASIGLAVLINQYVEQVVKRSPRLGKYQTISGIRGGWQAYRSAEVPLKLDVEFDKGRVSGEFMLAVFNNIRYYAAGKMTSPRARTDDGLLDAFLVKKCSFSRLAYIAFLTPPAAYADKKETITLQAPKFTVRSDKPFTIQIDGEVLSENARPRQFRNLEFASVPRALKIIS